MRKRVLELPPGYSQIYDMVGNEGSRGKVGWYADRQIYAYQNDKDEVIRLEHIYHDQHRFFEYADSPDSSVWFQSAWSGLQLLKTVKRHYPGAERKDMTFVAWTNHAYVSMGDCDIESFIKVTVKGIEGQPLPMVKP